MSTRRTIAGRYSVARVITGIGAVLALIEVVYILLVLFGANAGNAFYKFIQSMAVPLALFFPGLFTIQNQTLSVIVTYGLAAIFWMVVTGMIARFVG
ncbi:MAG TPA: hypothetical protein VH352_20310 [Pseudonocardiaceae bacterium]|jgi:hypothetical protein|nr:hypothetical protein [Pseudonocardiaceae bacterium]